jgi:hypothetical protein
MAIIFFGVSSTPADNGTSAVDPTAVTPPSSMVAGDLVLFVGTKRTGTGTMSISATGGQTWTSITSFNEATLATLSACAFWCTYNGTWSANPSISFGATTNNTAVLVVFRPSSSLNTWALDSGGGSANRMLNHNATTSWLGAGCTPDNDSNVTLNLWASDDDNTWGNLTGSGWTKTGLAAQYRNTAGQDSSLSLAYQIQTSKAATNTPSQDQLTLGGDGGIIGIFCFYETAPSTPAIPNKIYSFNQSINRASNF